MSRSNLLLIIRAGRQSIHRSYSLVCSRLVDILVSCHDDSDWSGSDAKFLHLAAGGKFQGIARLFAENPRLVDAYKHFWLFEDDLYLPHRSLETMLSLLDRHDFPLVAPALRPESFCNWSICMQNERMLLRGTDFVEIMAPIMSREFLRLCLPHFPFNYSGYGQEWMWRRIMRDTRRFAVVVDAAPIVHTRPHGKGSLAAHAPAEFIGFRQELQQFLAHHRFSAEDHFSHLFGITRSDPRRTVFRQDLIDAMLPGYETLMRLDHRAAMRCIEHLLTVNRPTMGSAEAQLLPDFASMQSAAAAAVPATGNMS